MEKSNTDVIIIGAGISGLSCAKRLIKEGIRFLVLEAGQTVGGRIKSDRVDGFILDHGFQVLQTTYPEARSLLDFDALDLKLFSPGVAVRTNGQLFYISDPIRRPQDLWGTLTAPIGTITDRLRILRLFAGNKIKGSKGIFESTDMRTIDFLRSYPFSDRIIERFFRPFFAGVCLDPDLNASSRVFRYLFNIFASGDAALPAKGMGAIPIQLSEGIPANQIRLGASVELIGDDGVTLTNGQKITGRTIVIATEGPETQRLLKLPVKSNSKGERCLYFSAEKPPISSPFLILNGEGKGLINNIAIPTLTAPSYSSSGRHLIAVVVLDHPSMDNESLEHSVRSELRQWFGDPVRNWEHIKTYHIDHALPDQSPPVSNPAMDSGRVRDGVYTCGEYQRIPGIQWALLSGRLTAEQIINENHFM
ncbi:NAD(P)/FAD-dependent oxidoreductase [Desulfobacula sp.]|uniref:NAD(P)/FAD-dependent oxidoreductase n=1 Tax=Desulfobacula sp. TaxID=2593537 RepID=UPI002635614B|nr:NAD(P)/FAD-dependent oxidoreductase [Desulfobacula sp.]